MPATSTEDFTALEHAILHDVTEIDDLDEFLTVDEAEAEDGVLAMLGNAGCFY